jgi:gamma-glutamyltranspeptidase / glutathione hydrolase
MMTDRWLNYVLSLVVVLGLLVVTVYNQPRVREERAAFLDQELVEVDLEVAAPEAPTEGVQLRQREPAEEVAPEFETEAARSEAPPALGSYGVSASNPTAVEVGMEVLEGGGNAIDAAVAVAYTLGVAEPFGSGIGGGGTMLIKRDGEEPRAIDYREVAPLDGVPPISDIGVPGFVAGMDQIHDEYGTVEIEDLIEYAARLAENGVVVDPYLNERLEGAAHRLPIHLLPRFFPGGQAITAGQVLYQPEYAEALRLIQQQGPPAFYEGPIGEQIAAAVTGLEMDDLRAYEVLEVEPGRGTFAGYELVSAGAPVAAPAVIQLLQTAEARGINDLDLTSADAYHVQIQAWRLANGQRIDRIGDPSMEDVDLAELLDPAVSQGFADLIPPDAFAQVPEDLEEITEETDTTHVVVIDADGTMVSMTNTLSNFFGSGMAVSGFFLNDQLKNFSPDPASVNAVGPLKRSRSFVAPLMLLDDQDRPVLGIGSPGGRRIPNAVAQVIVRWAGHGEDLEAAVQQPRFHMERDRLLVEAPIDDAANEQLVAWGYEIREHLPTTEYYGAIQALEVDWDSGEVTGADEIRRQGTWASSTRVD